MTRRRRRYVRRAAAAVGRYVARRGRAVGRAMPVLLDLAGFVLVSYGVWLIYRPAGFIAAGAAAIVTGMRFSSSDENAR